MLLLYEIVVHICTSDILLGLCRWSCSSDPISSPCFPDSDVWPDGIIKRGKVFISSFSIFCIKQSHRKPMPLTESSNVR